MGVLEANEAFAGYVIEGVLGQGGMGTVYLARHPRLPRQVALKLLNRDVSADEELRRRFEQEANVVARLDHPGIVGIYDRGTDDGHLWISMQYIRGTDAAQMDSRTVSVGRVLQIVTETAAALDYAHSQGVLHRDIKPANILFAEADAGREARAILTDFGIARIVESENHLTSTGTITATLAYASPEQLSGEVVDRRADQYSLACTLFTLLAGHSPYAATNPGQVVAGHLSKPVPRLSGLAPQLPEPLDHVIARAMAKRREDRFDSCAEFAAAAIRAAQGQRSALGGARTDPTLLNPRPEPIRDAGAVPQAAPIHHPAPSQWPANSTPATPIPRQRPMQHAGPIQRAVSTPQPIPFPPQYPSPMQHPLPQPGQWPQQPAGAVPRPPSRALPITAAVLAIPQGLLAGCLTFAMIMTAATPSTDAEGVAGFGAAAIAAAAVALSLLGGSIALLARKPAGRTLVAIGAAFVTVLFLVAVVLGITTSEPITAAVFTGLTLLPVITLVCATSAPTTRWLEAR